MPPDPTSDLSSEAHRNRMEAIIVTALSDARDIEQASWLGDSDQLRMRHNRLLVQALIAALDRP